MSLAQKKSTVHSHIGPVIIDLIEELEIQLDQEFSSYYKEEAQKDTLPMLELPPKSSPISESMLVETNAKNIGVTTNADNYVKVKTPISQVYDFSLIIKRV